MAKEKRKFAKFVNFFIFLKKVLTFFFVINKMLLTGEQTCIF